MDYVKNPPWMDGQSGGTRIDAANLNALEAGVFDAAATADAAVDRAPLMLLDYAAGDGTTDDTAGVQAAFDAAIAQDRALFSPPSASYLVDPLTVAGAMTLQGEFRFTARTADQAAILTITARQDWAAATVHCEGEGKALYGIRYQGAGSSRFGRLSANSCQIWGHQYDSGGNNNMVQTAELYADQNGKKSAQTLTETAQSHAAMFENGNWTFGTFTLSVPLDAKYIAADVAYFVVSGGKAYRIKTLTATVVEVYHLGIGVGNTVAANIHLGGGLNFVFSGDNGVCEFGTSYLSNIYGIAIQQAAQYGHTYNNTVIEVCGIGFAVHDYSAATALIKPYFEACDVDMVVWDYCEGVMVAPQMDISRIQHCLGRLNGGSGIGVPGLIVQQGWAYGLTGGKPANNIGTGFLCPGKVYAFSWTSGTDEVFGIDNDLTKYEAVNAFLIQVDIVHATTGTRGALSVHLNTNNGDTLMGAAFGTPFTATVTGSTRMVLFRVGTDWKVSLIREDLEGYVGDAPARVGQIAVRQGIGYIATGTASAADWKQITA